MSIWCGGTSKFRGGWSRDGARVLEGGGLGIRRDVQRMHEKTMACERHKRSGPGGGDFAGCSGRVAGGKELCRVNRTHGYLRDKKSTNMKMTACINNGNSQ